MLRDAIVFILSWMFAALSGSIFIMCCFAMFHMVWLNVLLALFVLGWIVSMVYIMYYNFNTYK